MEVWFIYLSFFRICSILYPLIFLPATCLSRRGTRLCTKDNSTRRKRKRCLVCGARNSIDSPSRIRYEKDMLNKISCDGFQVEKQLSKRYVIYSISSFQKLEYFILYAKRFLGILFILKYIIHLYLFWSPFTMVTNILYLFPVSRQGSLVPTQSGFPGSGLHDPSALQSLGRRLGEIHTQVCQRSVELLERALCGILACPIHFFWERYV